MELEEILINRNFPDGFSFECEECMKKLEKLKKEAKNDYDPETRAWMPISKEEIKDEE